MTKKKVRVFSAPTDGAPASGNYSVQSAITSRCKTSTMIYCIVDVHALTTSRQRKIEAKHVRHGPRLAGCRHSPEESIVFVHRTCRSDGTATYLSMVHRW